MIFSFGAVALLVLAVAIIAVIVIIDKNRK